ncbi:7254_t:CDS:2 [Funneliformis mosseae]|uniref:7254_t:CDS:1 n=1 Tax=Funneliformis mosseae TaxID=27381 RepID=A0A9N9ACA7_FUNMO|nr:7254_t:CDS:2 [Funneliformis mosseae]
MNVNWHENEVQDVIEYEFNKLNVLDKNCSYCDKPFVEKLWCKECDPWCMIEGWTNDGSWKKSDPKPMKVALKRLNGSRDMSAKYFSELKAHWDIFQTGTDELYDTIDFWNASIIYDWYKDIKEYGYYGKEIKKAFEAADKEIQNISISRKTNPDAIYTSRAFTFKTLTKPINSSLITSYLEKDENNEEFQDSQLIELGIPSSSQLRGYVTEANTITANSFNFTSVTNGIIAYNRPTNNNPIFISFTSFDKQIDSGCAYFINGKFV